ncbi:adaptin ear-binding coat-associated protein [Striga asiatica]|uniref:Adaptin ear-binding coat-associated protein n=1 Tax=Striga asiatica TaxID=4170 RepID=A0A5A7R1N3_STRAF|nr:adaptin ear-binding coat-associated protein [Striga asiatica]
MSYEEDEEAFDHALLVVREVSVFKIPPRPTSGGYKCGEWLQSDKIWTGRLRVVFCNSRCEIRLEDPSSGDLFAACFVNPGQREIAVEPALGSSRYFVLRIEDGRGKHAFIGLGFNERNEAFDFNVALSDHEKYVKREVEKEAGGSGAVEGGEDGQIDIHPAVHHRLKKVQVEIFGKPAKSEWAGMLSAAGKSKTLSLASPPNTAMKIRSPLPPPPNDPAAARMNSTNHGGGLNRAKDNSSNCSDFLSDLSQLKIQRHLPFDPHDDDLTHHLYSDGPFIAAFTIGRTISTWTMRIILTRPSYFSKVDYRTQWNLRVRDKIYVTVIGEGKKKGVKYWVYLNNLGAAWGRNGREMVAKRMVVQIHPILDALFLALSDHRYIYFVPNSEIPLSTVVIFREVTGLVNIICMVHVEIVRPDSKCSNEGPTRVEIFDLSLSSPAVDFSLFVCGGGKDTECLNFTVLLQISSFVLFWPNFVEDIS